MPPSSRLGNQEGSYAALSALFDICSDQRIRAADIFFGLVLTLDNSVSDVVSGCVYLLKSPQKSRAYIDIKLMIS